ncbi:type II toxin-antitoxin system HipA family toxin [bacterium]|nr:MAG: type II toxin-antitoxin system HipA family toxin [bacterium]
MATDVRSLESLEVLRDGVPVGFLDRLPDGCRFSYLPEFLLSSQEPIARHLPKSPEGVVVRGLTNLPSYFAGLLPEGLMFDVAVRMVRTSRDDLFSLLAATGSDAIGDITVRVPGEEPSSHRLDLTEAMEEIQNILSGHGATPGTISAIAGVQPKISLGGLFRTARTALTIAKFQPREFPNLLQNEAAIMRLAARCGLPAAKVELREEALLVTRFDRVLDRQTRRLRQVHVEDALQLMNLYPHRKYTLDYREILQVIEGLHAGKAALLDALRLYVFSYLVGNGDLHAKNVSLLYERETRRWRMTPAYDLLSTLPYASLLSGADRMALALEDEAFGRFEAQDFIEMGSSFDLPESAVLRMIQNLGTKLLFRLPDLEGLPEATVAEIERRARALLAR